MRLNYYQRPASPGPGVKYSQCERGDLGTHPSAGKGGRITHRVNGGVLSLLSANTSLRVNEGVWEPVAKQETVRRSDAREAVRRWRSWNLEECASIAGFGVRLRHFLRLHLTPTVLLPSGLHSPVAVNGMASETEC